MPVTLIANTFPKHWTYGLYEQNINNILIDQLNQRWPMDDNLLVGTTWLGPNIDNQIHELETKRKQFQRLVIVSTVDAALRHQVYPLIDRLCNIFNITQVYRVGNFDTEYDFNLFAWACLDNFRQYQTEDLVLRDLKHTYCAYNRKPYLHRVKLVKTFVDQGLEPHGVITLGKSFPGEPDHGLYRSIGEKNQDYVIWGHWYSDSPEATSHDIPHDLFSLHNWQVWQHHFLHIVGSTEAHNEPDTFVNQINFKPLIGMRPYVINGQTKQYNYLRRYGFRTFNHYWPQFDIERGYDTSCRLAESIANVVKWLVSLEKQEIINMYTDMLPDLIYNRERWFEYAKEQQHKIEHLFYERP